MERLTKIEQLEQLLPVLTDGEWNEFSDEQSSDVITSTGEHVACDCATADDALFISRARNLMPYLLAAARALASIQQDLVLAAQSGRPIAMTARSYQDGLLALKGLK